MEAHQLLNLREIEPWVVGDGSIVKAQEQSLKLRDDDVFVVPGIPYERAPDLGVIPRQVPRVRVAAASDRLSEQKCGSIIVEVRLIVGTAAIDVIQIERGRAKVGQCVRVVLFGQTAHRIKGDVVIQELAEVGVESRNAALLVILAVLRRIETGGHRGAERVEIRQALVVVFSEPGGR